MMLYGWVIALSFLCLIGWVSFRPADMKEIAERYGYVFAPNHRGQAPRRPFLILVRHLALSALFTLFLIGAPMTVVFMNNYNPVIRELTGWNAAFLILFLLHIVRRVKEEGWLHGDRGGVGGKTKEVTVLDAETRLEAELARRRLYEAGVDARIKDDRAIVLTGTDAFWSFCRPRYPAFTVYRGLGGGMIRLLAAKADADRAREMLARFLACRPEGEEGYPAGAAGKESPSVPEGGFEREPEPIPARSPGEEE